MPSDADSFEVLCLQAADAGRGAVLFGDSLARARKAARPFMVGNEFPSVYLEFPLIGEPSLDVTVLLDDINEGTRIDSPAAAGSGPMLDWFAQARHGFEGICCGFELDTKKAEIPAAALHFQPRVHTGLVVPFFEAIGEPHRAQVYLNQAKRMPQAWPLSFFGLFRGRPGSPLRICGYLDERERDACAQDPARLAEVFETIGFAAYDNALLARASQLMAAAPSVVDFQFDVFDDGHLGPTFALDLQFGIEQPEVVRAAFAGGQPGQVMCQLEDWGAADERWKLAPAATFARSVDVELDDGSCGRLAFTLMPQWVKARWTASVLQPSKLYFLARAKLVPEGQ